MMRPMTTFLNTTLLNDDALQHLCGSVQKEWAQAINKQQQHQHSVQECDERLMALAEERDRRIFQDEVSWKTILPIRDPITSQAQQSWIEWCSSFGLMGGKQDHAIKQWVVECAIDLLEEPHHFERQQQAVKQALPWIAFQNDPWGTPIKRIDLTLDYQAEEHVQFFIGATNTEIVYMYRQRRHAIDRMPFEGWSPLWKAAGTYLWWIGEDERTADQLHLISEGSMLLVNGKTYHWERE